MQYLRCKCGKCEAWSSMGSNPACSGCEDCKTTLETHPSLHRDIEPHKWVQRFKASDGTRDKDLCVECLRTQEPAADTPTSEERYQTDGIQVQ